MEVRFPMSKLHFPRRSFFESLVALPFGLAAQTQRASPTPAVVKVAAGMDRFNDVRKLPGGDLLYVRVATQDSRGAFFMTEQPIETHMASSRYNIAALGTVFTHPDQRGRGLAKICCSHVLNSISYAGIHRVVLNVEDEKVAARGIYERLGFQTACTYRDGECVRI